MARISDWTVRLSLMIVQHRLCRSDMYVSESSTKVFWPGLVLCSEIKEGEYSHALDMELMAARQTHDLTDSIDILLQANHAFHLPSHVFLPLT